MPEMKAPSRIAFVEVEDFSLAALLRASPELAGLPVAITRGAGTHATVYQASLEARAGGIKPGLGVARARQRLPELKPLAPSQDAETNAHASLLEVAFAFSPRIAEADPGSIYLDLSGLGGLYESEAGLATALDAALARLGLPCHIGMGANKTLARIGARMRAGIVRVPTGDETAFLEPLPVRVLDPSPELAKRLDAWGIRDLGALGRLSEPGIVRRLGAEGAVARALAQGRDDQPFVPLVPQQIFEERMSFDDWTIDNLEALMQVAGELIERLLLQLRKRGLAAHACVIDLSLEPRGHDLRHIEFAAPLGDRRAILELLRHDLAIRPAQAAIAAIRAVALPAAPQTVQGQLFAPASPTPERVAVTLARLYALVGEGCLGAPVRPARRAPGAIAAAPFKAVRTLGRPAVAGAAAGLRPQARPVLALSVLRPPRSVAVEWKGMGIEALHLDGRRHAVRRAAGPWRIDEGWWTTDPTCRDDYDVELDDGRLIRIYQEVPGRAWFWDGVYG